MKDSRNHLVYKNVRATLKSGDGAKVFSNLRKAIKQVSGAKSEKTLEVQLRNPTIEKNYLTHQEYCVGVEKIHRELLKVIPLPTDVDCGAYTITLSFLGKDEHQTAHDILELIINEQ